MISLLGAVMMLAAQSLSINAPAIALVGALNCSSLGLKSVVLRGSMSVNDANILFTAPLGVRPQSVTGKAGSRARPPAKPKSKTQATRGRKLKRAPMPKEGGCQVTVYFEREGGGKRTASGKPFRDNGLTVALPPEYFWAVPFGSLFRISYGGRSIDLEYTDHCPERGTWDVTTKAIKYLVGPGKSWNTRLFGAKWKLLRIGPG